jgi:hypothetical protein
VAAVEPGGEGLLGGGVHGEEGVGDDFQTSHGGLDECGWAAGGDPGDLHLREGADLADAGEDEGKAGGRTGGEAGLGGGEGVVEEDLIDDESEVVGGAEIFEGEALGGGGEVSGGVVGVDKDDSAGAWRDGRGEGVQVDEPGVGAGGVGGVGIVVEGVFAEDDVVEGGDEVKEWITGAGDQDLVAGIAEEAKEEAVGL